MMMIKLMMKISDFHHQFIIKFHLETSLKELNLYFNIMNVKLFLLKQFVLCYFVFYEHKIRFILCS